MTLAISGGVPPIGATRPHTFRAYALLVVCAAISIALFACGDEEAAGGGGDGTGGGTDICATSADCNTEAGFEGTLCVVGACDGCTDHAACQSDSVYGSQALCNSAGRCAVCTDTNIGCDCDADNPCVEGECLAGVCADCVAGSLGCICNEDETCAVGARCDSAAGVCDTCPEGEEACPCVSEDDSCDEGLTCLMDLCAAETCEIGEAGCPCDEGDICDVGVGCHADSFCYTCDADALDCECVPDVDGCSMGFVCDADTEACRDALTCDECIELQLCDEAENEGEDDVCLEACVDGYGWVADACEPLTCSESGGNSRLNECAGTHRTCSADNNGAFCGECAIGFVDDGGDCRAALTCEDIAETCEDEARACDEGNTSTDATCGVCLHPFVESGGSCVPSDDTNCITDDEDTLVDYCESQGQVCDEGDGGPASCGDCLNNFFVNPATGACEVQRSCVELGCATFGRECGNEPFATCGDCLGGLKLADPDDPTSACVLVRTCFHLDCGDDFCVESDTGGDASCVASVCAPGESWSDLSDACVSCGTSCCAYDSATGSCTPDDGTTGRLYLTARDGSDSCICETLPGYYFDSSLAFAAFQCDEDGDGWVRAAAESFVNSNDAVLRANARCDIKTIDTITLVNEFEQTYEVKLCDDGDIWFRGEGEGDCGQVAPLALYEDTLLDRDDSIEGFTFPNWRIDGVGRRPIAAEVNPLTKACIDAFADFNSNGIPDFEEAQGVSLDNIDLNPLQTVLSHFAFFTELHRGWYEARPLEDYGTYVIAERSRCDVGSAEVPFALGYSDAELGSYWQECSRNRRASFDLDTITSGYDFARWSCSETAGGCTMPPPPTNITPDGFVPDHGLCEVPLPPDATWRGMNHHSQFRCAQLVDTVMEPGYQVDLEALFDGANDALYQFNDCGIACDEDDCGDTTEVGRFGVNPSAPILTCDTSVTPSEGDIGFVSVRYLDSDGMGYAYDEGCIDESELWPVLCPGFAINGLLGTVADGRFNDFGSLVCGCGVHYGGVNCEIGCPDVAVDPAYNPLPRSGTWLCGGIEASYAIEEDETYGPLLVGSDGDDVYVLEAAVPHVPVVRERLCEDAECATGGFVAY